MLQRFSCVSFWFQPPCTDWLWNGKCGNYIQQEQLKKTKSRPKRDVNVKKW